MPLYVFNIGTMIYNRITKVMKFINYLVKSVINFVIIFVIKLFGNNLFS